MNLVLLSGTLSRPPEARVLPSGDQLLSFELTIRDEGQPTATVPVSWPDPPAAAWLEPGVPVVVTGRVRRRFFRAGGLTQSRTEVVAERVAPHRQPVRARKVVEVARERLAGAPF